MRKYKQPHVFPWLLTTSRWAPWHSCRAVTLHIYVFVFLLTLIRVGQHCSTTAPHFKFSKNLRYNTALESAASILGSDWWVTLQIDRTSRWGAACLRHSSSFSPFGLTDVWQWHFDLPLCYSAIFGGLSFLVPIPNDTFDYAIRSSSHYRRLSCSVYFDDSSVFVLDIRLPKILGFFP